MWREHRPEARARVLQEFTELLGQTFFGSCTLIDNGQIDVHRIEVGGLGFEILHTAIDDFLHDRIGVSADRNVGIVALDHVLIKPELLIENARACLEAASELLQLGNVPALVVEALQSEHNQEVAAFGQEGVIVEDRLDGVRPILLGGAPDV